MLNNSMKEGHSSVCEFSKHFNKYFKHHADVALSVSQSQTVEVLSTLKIIEQVLIFFLSTVSRIQLLNSCSDPAAGFFHSLEHWD